MRLIYYSLLFFLTLSLKSCLNDHAHDQSLHGYNIDYQRGIIKFLEEPRPNAKVMRTWNSKQKILDSILSSDGHYIYIILDKQQDLLRIPLGKSSHFRGFGFSKAPSEIKKFPLVGTPLCLGGVGEDIIIIYKESSFEKFEEKTEQFVELSNLTLNKKFNECELKQSKTEENKLILNINSDGAILTEFIYTKSDKNIISQSVHKLNRNSLKSHKSLNISSSTHSTNPKTNSTEWRSSDPDTSDNDVLAMIITVCTVILVILCISIPVLANFHCKECARCAFCLHECGSCIYLCGQICECFVQCTQCICCLCEMAK